MTSLIKRSTITLKIIHGKKSVDYVVRGTIYERYIVVVGSVVGTFCYNNRVNFLLSLAPSSSNSSNESPLFPYSPCPWSVKFGPSYCKKPLFLFIF